MKSLMMLVVIVLLSVVNIVLADNFGIGANEFTIDFVTISGDTNPTSGYGIVNNDYRIGKFEITNDQWDKLGASFYGTLTGSPLNAYNESATWTGANVPTNGVSWYEAAQFVNYLNLSTGHARAYKFTGVHGTANFTLSAWEMIDTGYDPSNPFRNSNAHYFIPTEDEWVKAAYWNGTNMQTYATKAGESLIQGDGTSGNGWSYGHNYPIFPPIDSNGPWDVGSGSEELNGTFDMMGNVNEWMEGPYYSGDYLSDSLRGYRGGSFRSTSDGFLSSSNRVACNPFEERYSLGFRVASVIPEPCSLVLLSLGGLVLRKRKTGGR